MGNVRYLLDTHTFLWAAQDEARLSNSALTIIEDNSVYLFVSAVSAYEIMYKHRIGKLLGYDYVAKNYSDILTRLGVNELPISTQHAYFAGKFEWAHRDPFDRLLAAQASIENMTIITNDEAFHSLSWIDIFW